MTSTLTRSKVTEAVARGWTWDRNSHKQMDADLASAIVDEVCMALSSAGGTRGIVQVPIETLDRIARDCEHGSRIWKEIDALMREHRLAPSSAPVPEETVHGYSFPPPLGPTNAAALLTSREKLADEQIKRDPDLPVDVGTPAAPLPTPAASAMDIHSPFNSCMFKESCHPAESALNRARELLREAWLHAHSHDFKARLAKELNYEND